MKFAHFGLFLVLMIGFGWIFVHPKPRGRPRRKPNPLTTDRERIMGGVVLGGALLKAQHDQRVRQQQPNQGPSPNNWW